MLFRGVAPFANPGIYEYLEDERDRYSIRQLALPKPIKRWSMTTFSVHDLSVGRGRRVANTA
jgi:hypothetical protein